jgi:hypothetical protein
MAYQRLQAGRAEAVTPSDTVPIPAPGGGDGVSNGCVLYVGVSGDLKVTTTSGDETLFSNVPVGFFPVQVLYVWATGTTATNIVALW